jgi:hypothetical protein
MKSKFLKTKLVVGLAIVCAASMANAALISFGGIAATDGSVTTSGRPADSDWVGGVGSNILSPSSGFFIETFDYATRNTDLPVGLYAGDVIPANVNINNNGDATCGINSWGSLDFDLANGSLGVQQVNNGNGAHNNANSTCFGFTPQPGGSTPSTLVVDFSAFIGVGASIDYFGLYFGSVDTYNFLEFGSVINGVFSAIDVDGFGTVLSGTEILDEIQAQSGNRDSANVYLNIDFGATETFTAFRMTTNQIAMEIDNVVIGLENRGQIPEPSPIALLSIGLLGLAITRRKNKN